MRTRSAIPGAASDTRQEVSPRSLALPGGASSAGGQTVIRPPLAWNSDTMRDGSYGKTVRRAGTYRIVCTIHSSDMRMTLQVRR